MAVATTVDDVPLPTREIKEQAVNEFTQSKNIPDWVKFIEITESLTGRWSDSGQILKSIGQNFREGTDDWIRRTRW